MSIRSTDHPRLYTSFGHSHEQIFHDEFLEVKILKKIIIKKASPYYRFRVFRGTVFSSSSNNGERKCFAPRKFNDRLASSSLEFSFLRTHIFLCAVRNSIFELLRTLVNENRKELTRSWLNSKYRCFLNIFLFVTGQPVRCRARCRGYPQIFWSRRPERSREDWCCCCCCCSSTTPKNYGSFVGIWRGAGFELIRSPLCCIGKCWHKYRLYVSLRNPPHAPNKQHASRFLIPSTLNSLRSIPFVDLDNIINHWQFTRKFDIKHWNQV